jgi:hypothetical protein
MTPKTPAEAPVRPLPSAPFIYLKGAKFVPVLSIVFGVLLIALGVWGYWGGVLNLWQPLGFAAPEHLSLTALIPAYMGAALVLLGLLALKESLLKHAMHAAALIGVLGLLAASWRLISKGEVKSVAGASLAAMTLLSALFVVLCVNSFIQARRRRRAAANPPIP